LRRQPDIEKDCVKRGFENRQKAQFKASLLPSSEKRTDYVKDAIHEYEVKELKQSRRSKSHLYSEQSSANFLSPPRPPMHQGESNMVSAAYYYPKITYLKPNPSMRTIRPLESNKVIERKEKLFRKRQVCPKYVDRISGRVRFSTTVGSNQEATELY
jgi:hypothetical protein